MNKTFRFIVILFTVIFVIFSAMFGVLAAHKVSEISLGSEIYIDGLEESDNELGMINVLLIGVDDGGYRSDTIMLLSIDSYSSRINLMSIPRDTMVKPKGYATTKINALIGLGKELANKGKISEPEEFLIEQVKELTGIPIHYFVSIDFDGFKDIIDAVDGVDFNVPYDMSYDDPAQNLHIHLKAGQQHLDGQAAHDFVRFRHNNDGSAPGEYVLGDEGREYWQQEFLKELFNQKCTPKYISKIDDLFAVVKENVRTNYTMRDLIKHLGLVKTLNFDDVGSYVLPGEAQYISPLWWYINDADKTSELIKEVFLPMNEEEWEKYRAENSNDNRTATEYGLTGGSKIETTAEDGTARSATVGSAWD